MERAKVICHMCTSIDGKINAGFPRSTDIDHVSEIYEQLNYSYGQAIAIGRNTIDDGRRPDLSVYTGAAPDYHDSIIRDEVTYGIVFDRKGKLCWDSEYQRIPSLPERRTLIVMTEQADRRYMNYLDDRKIPYMFCGKEELDLELVLEKLYRDYDIHTMVLGGGATLNGAFFQADLVDELSIVVTPGISNKRHGLTLAEGENQPAIPRFYKLKEVEKIGHNGVILRYDR